MTTLRVGGNQGLPEELVRQARQQLQTSRTLSPNQLTELKQTAIRYGGTISEQEASFIANLDNQDVVNKLLDANFNPQTLQLDVNKADKSRTLSSGQAVNAGTGDPVFKADGTPNQASLLKFRQANNPTGQKAACSANSSVATLMMDGPAALKTAMGKMISHIGSPPSPQNAGRHATLTRMQADIDAGTLTTGDLNKFASMLYDEFDSNKSDQIMSYPDIIKMQQALGLGDAQTQAAQLTGPSVGQVTFSTVPPDRGAVIGSSINPASDTFKEAQKQMAKQLTDQIKPGERGLVSVYLGKQGTTDQPNHIISVSKAADGRLTVYDPEHMPSTLTGGKAEKHLASKMGLSLAHPQLVSGTETYTASIGATYIPQKKL